MTYYTVAQAPTRNTLGRAAPIADELQAIQDAFAKLPDEAPLKRGRVWYAATVGGTANAITLTMASTMTSPYVAGDIAFFLAGSDNTGAATVNIDGVGAVAIRQPDGTALAAGNIQAGAVTLIAYNGSTWNLVGGYVSTDQQTLAAIAADISAVAAISANVTSVAGNASNINTVAGSITNVNTVGGSIASVNTVAARDADIATVAARDADIATLADLEDGTTATGAIQAVAAVAASVPAVANVDSEVVTVAGIGASVSAVAAVAASVPVVAGISADVSAVAAVAADVTTAAENITDINTFTEVWQGAKAANPTTRNDGSALQAGDAYFNTTANEIRAYSGSVWGAGNFGASVTDLTVADTATFDGLTTHAAAGEAAEGNPTDVSGNVVLQATGAPVLRNTLTGDTAYTIAGAPTPGHGWSVDLRTTQSTGSHDVTFEPVNEIIYSRDLQSTTEAGETRPWTDNNTSLDDNAAVGPDGQTTLTKLIADATTSTHDRGQTLTGLAPSQTITGSVVVRDAGDSLNIKVYLDDPDATPNFIVATVNPSTGAVVTAPLNGGNASGGTLTVTPLQNNCYRIDLTGQVNTSGTRTRMRVRLMSGTTDSFLGDGTSGAHVGNVQVTPGQPVGMIEVGASRTSTYRIAADEIDDASDGAGVERVRRINVKADGTIELENLSVTNFERSTVTDGITAGTTQTQAGATALTTQFNRVSTVGTSGDGVALPAAETGREVLIINDGANALQVWPATGDAIDGGAADAVDGNTLAAASSRRYIAIDATNWHTA